MPTSTDRTTLWVRDQLRLRAFERVASLLIQAGVPVVPVKGIALARWLYADAVDRPMCDVDLFVPSASWTTARAVLIARYTALYDTSELRELTVAVEGVLVELHGEVGRRELTRMTVDEMIGRATRDTTTFPFEVLRLDDVDHLLLMACNAIKDGFVFAQAHVPADLERLLERTGDRTSVLLDRARAAGLGTGLYCTAEWMVDMTGSERWRSLMKQLAPPPRPWHARLIRRFRKTRHPTWSAAVVLGRCLTNDVAALRWRATGRVLRRNAVKLVGRTPP
jgi:hypothetical protein